LKDIQNQRDHRNIPIDRVGVRNLSYPITVFDKAHKEQPTVAEITLSIGLPHEYRGTHMSRFIEILNEYRWGIHVASVKEILWKMRERLPAHSAHLAISFPYFLEKISPVSKERSLMGYQCRLIASLEKREEVDLQVGIRVPVMTLCPCSKEISQYGAHNQRCLVDILVRFERLVWIEELIEIAESSGSSQVYSLLKREDEKYVTEQAYQNPAFVEDVVRDVALKIEADSRINWFSVEAESMESIHNHNAFASVARRKEGDRWVRDSG
jgi:GTP cyclohydrolase I